MAPDGQFETLYAAARAARSQAQQTARRTERVLQEADALSRLYLEHCATAERLGRLWLFGQPDRLRYSPYARMQARLASMPVIEQAKGIIMAQCGWTADEAFDALRRASQRENIRVRDLSARIVANTAKPREPPMQDGADGASRRARVRRGPPANELDKAAERDKLVG